MAVPHTHILAGEHLPELSLTQYHLRRTRTARQDLIPLVLVHEWSVFLSMYWETRAAHGWVSGHMRRPLWVRFRGHSAHRVARTSGCSGIDQRKFAESGLTPQQRAPRDHARERPPSPAARAPSHLRSDERPSPNRPPHCPPRPEQVRRGEYLRMQELGQDSFRARGNTRKSRCFTRKAVS